MDIYQVSVVYVSCLIQSPQKSGEAANIIIFLEEKMENCEVYIICSRSLENCQSLYLNTSSLILESVPLSVAQFMKRIVYFI